MSKLDQQRIANADASQRESILRRYWSQEKQQQQQMNNVSSPMLSPIGTGHQQQQMSTTVFNQQRSPTTNNSMYVGTGMQQQHSAFPRQQPMMNRYYSFYASFIFFRFSGDMTVMDPQQQMHQMNVQIPSTSFASPSIGQQQSVLENLINSPQYGGVTNMTQTRRKLNT